MALQVRWTAVAYTITGGTVTSASKIAAAIVVLEAWASAVTIIAVNQTT